MKADCSVNWQKVRMFRKINKEIGQFPQLEALIFFLLWGITHCVFQYNRITNTEWHIHAQQKHLDRVGKQVWSILFTQYKLVTAPVFFFLLVSFSLCSQPSTSLSHAFHLWRLRWQGPPAGSGWNYRSAREWNGDKACEAGSWQSLSVLPPWGMWRAATCFSLAAILLALRARLHVSQPCKAQPWQWWAKLDLCALPRSLGKMRYPTDAYLCQEGR